MSSADLACEIGQGASADPLIEDLADELTTRPYEIARTGDACALRTPYASAIRAVADLSDERLDLRGLAVRAATP